MDLPLARALRTVEVTMPQCVSGLQVFGLRWQATTRFQYLTLDEAMASGTLEFSEISQSGSVPELKVTNRSELMTLLMAGEQLIGAKQNRVLNVTIMVPAATEMTVPVSCVEAGRWNYRSPKLASGGTMSHGMLRKLIADHSSRSYKREGTPQSEQGEVWSEVSRKLTAMGSVSSSQEFNQIYKDHQAGLDELTAQFAAPADCQGAAFAIGGRIAGADLFDQAKTLAQLWPKLIRAYALDALELPPSRINDEVSQPTLQQWIRGAAEAPFEPFKSPGAGQDVRFQVATLSGSALVLDDLPVHVELFSGPTGPV
jgi:hypothetical protein